MSKRALKEVPKRAQLRVIDKGTRYDVIGNLKRLEREIERGEYGQVRDVIVLFTKKENNRSHSVEMRHFGSGSTPEIHYMLTTGTNRIVPS